MQKLDGLFNAMSPGTGDDEMPVLQHSSAYLILQSGSLPFLLTHFQSISRST